MRRLIGWPGRLYRKIKYLGAVVYGLWRADNPEAVDAGFLKALRLVRATFDDVYYVEHNEDVGESGLGPWQHFLRFGLAEGRRARFFDARYYLWKNRDVFRQGVDPFEHYRTCGRTEGREARFAATVFSAGPQGVDYETWQRRRADERRARVSDPASHAGGPLISVVMPTYNSDIRFLDRAIASVLSQSYPALELCIADDASPSAEVRERILHWAALDPRIKYAFRPENGHISAATNTAIALAAGDYIAFMDHDDELADDALARVAQVLADHPDCVLLYSDEDKIDEQGRLSAPHFKSDFNYELLLAQNYLNHLTVVRTAEVRRLGGLRIGFEGAQDHDFLLRLCGSIPREAIRHVPEVLYHWRMTSGSTARSLGVKPYVEQAAIAALTEHCQALGVEAEISAMRPYGFYRVSYSLLAHRKVSIVIPASDQVDLTRQCLRSLLGKTAYDNYEITIATTDPGAARNAFAEMRRRGVRVMECPGAPNRSRLTNQAVAEAGGDFVVLLDNDIEVIKGDWLAEMLRYAQMPDVGCVGARLLYPDMTLQHGGVVLGVRGLAGYAHNGSPAGAPGYFGRAMLPQQMSAVAGACLMVRRSIYLDVGGLDEALPAFADIDFCLRVEATGCRNIWTPYAELIRHKPKPVGAAEPGLKPLLVGKEVQLMLDRWGERLRNDPYYNPNLTLARPDFSIRTQ